MHIEKSNRGMPERIFILNGHPGPSSITRQAMDRYAVAAQATGHEVRLSQLHDLSFDSDRGRAGYENAKTLEPVLEEAPGNLDRCSHHSARAGAEKLERELCYAQVECFEA